MKEIKVEWCMDFIKKTFEKHVPANGGIEVDYFWKLAIKAGLWDGRTFGGPISEALGELTEVEIVRDDDENYLFSVFRLK